MKKKKSLFIQENIFGRRGGKKKKVDLIINSSLKLTILSHRDKINIVKITLETPEAFTLAGEVENSPDAAFAGEDVDGVLALVLVCGLVDLQPQLLSCDSTLHSV